MRISNLDWQFYQAPSSVHIYIYFVFYFEQFFWFWNLGCGFDLVCESFSELSEWKCGRTVSLFCGGIGVNDWDLGGGYDEYLGFLFRFGY